MNVWLVYLSPNSSSILLIMFFVLFVYAKVRVISYVWFVEMGRVLMAPPARLKYLSVSGFI